MLNIDGKVFFTLGLMAKTLKPKLTKRIGVVGLISVVSPFYVHPMPDYDNS